MNTFLLIVHSLVGVALLGTISHQIAAGFRNKQSVGDRSGLTRFWRRYTSVDSSLFSSALVVLYILCFIFGALIYPAYRLDVRTSFEDMGYFPMVGLFEIKEHLAALGLAVFPVYIAVSRKEKSTTHNIDRAVLSLFIGGVIWYDFIVGHVLNNIRGFG